MGCDADPHYQLAAFLNEACQFESDMRLGIEIAEGTCRPAVFSRCGPMGRPTDLYWGLRALVWKRFSPRRSLEFRKYASWSLLRCRMRVTRPDFGGNP